MGRRLYVGNIPYSSGEDDLRDLFGKIGQVESVSVPTDMATGRPRGFAFVEMSSDDDAARAVTETEPGGLPGTPAYGQRGAAQSAAGLARSGLRRRAPRTALVGTLAVPYGGEVRQQPRR